MTSAARTRLATPLNVRGPALQPATGAGTTPSGEPLFNVPLVSAEKPDLAKHYRILASDLAFHPTAPCSYTGSATAPAIIALVRSVTGAPRAIQATYLSPDGKDRTGRATFAALLGGAVRLAPPGPSLAVGEGLETCASFQELHGLPTWATLGTANLQAFTPPACVRHLTIAADGDAAGVKAAHALAARLRSRCAVTISAAPAGTDWNDVASGCNHV